MPPTFALLWNWEHDFDFAERLERACRERDVAFESVPENALAAAVEWEEGGHLPWDALLDRAWESDPRFLRLTRLAEASGVRVLNAPDRSAAIGNKAAAHAVLTASGVEMPRQVDFSPNSWDTRRLCAESSGWAGPTWLKPATGSGGGEGVVPLETLPDAFPLDGPWLEERFLLQEHVEPLRLAGRPAWFRVVVAFERVFPVWWDPATHASAPLSAAEEAEHGLGVVSETAARVAEIAGIELFSTEIALVAPGRAVVVDPVNDPVDLRPRSAAADGLPDPLLDRVAAALADGIRGILRAPRLLPATDTGDGGER